MKKKVGVISHMMMLDMQDYGEIVTHYNISNSHEKPVAIFNNDSYDIFGFLPKNVFFSDTNVVTKIVKIFDSSPKIAVVVGSQCFDTGTPYFLKKDKQKKVSSYQEIIDFVNKYDLEKVKLKENLFVHYE